MQRTLFEPDHDVFRQTFRQFLAREVVPYYEQWERDRIVPRAAWLAAGGQGVLVHGCPGPVRRRRGRRLSVQGSDHRRDRQGERRRAFVDRRIEEETAGTLTTATASMAKWWASDMTYRVTDRCLQLHGGYGHRREYGIARMYADSRVAMIYGGSNEIMKEIIGRQLLKGD